jgi:hypothetical protein
MASVGCQMPFWLVVVQGLAIRTIHGNLTTEKNTDAIAAGMAFLAAGSLNSLV